MNSSYPVDSSDEILSSYIYDYLTKRGFEKTASTLKNEVESTTPSDRTEKCRLQPPTVDMPSGFLFEWFGMFWDVFSSRYESAMTDKDAQAGKAEGVVPHDQIQPIEQRTEFNVQGFGSHNQRQGAADIMGNPPGPGRPEFGALASIQVAQANPLHGVLGSSDVRAQQGRDGLGIGNALGFGGNPYPMHRNGRTSASKKARETKTTAVSEEQNVSEESKKLDGTNAEASINTSNMGRKRSQNQNAAAAKRGRSNSAALESNAARGAAGETRSVHRNAILAATQAAVQAAAEAGEQLPNDAKPLYLTGQGLLYSQDEQYKLWPGGKVLPTLPGELTDEATESLFRSVLNNRTIMKSPEPTNATDENMFLMGVDRKAGDSVSSRSAVGEGLVPMMMGMNDKTIESAKVENNVGSLLKAEGPKMAGRGRPRIVEQDTSAGALERPRSRGGKRGGTGAQRQQATTPRTAMMSGMGTAGQQRGLANELAKQSSKSNVAADRMPDETDFFGSLSASVGVGRNSIAGTDMVNNFHESINFDGMQMRKGVTDDPVLENFFGNGGDDGMSMIGEMPNTPGFKGEGQLEIQQTEEINSQDHGT
eukprot:CAMPEP_0184754446 /NCGR_PEP_ID=MMETSP0315-20130426/44626_1 /TAXON_ID=101924 /ORGANISM="Rhodosorus marinus, Strain UTEX LB 2760" /LENGTH=592 /DNA_ID=CAMNT_0027233869 /DNA_START=124 /DNA_END=1903 /DNA_ORIENTATION=-